MFDAHSTTILSVRRGRHVAIAGDGQVSLGNTIMKGNARKIRRLYKNRILAGFAGGTADAFTLFERFEGKLEEQDGQLLRAAVELAKDWRTDRIAAIGSGGMFALSAARALYHNTEMDALTIARKSLEIASDICVYTNHNIITDELKG